MLKDGCLLANLNLMQINAVHTFWLQETVIHSPANCQIFIIGLIQIN